MPSIINTSRIAIVGLGQLGGSLARRIKEIGCTSLYAIARREETIKKAMELGILDGASTCAEDILPVVDITFMCLPLAATIEFVKTNLQHFRVGSIVTDVGSVKGFVVKELRNSLYKKGIYFIGAHPMAGSEKSGLENSRSDLYENAVVFLTPTGEDEPSAIDLVRHFWRDIGACPIEIDADRHDKALAFSSHALHLISASLCHTILGKGDVEARKLANAGGFRDMTRIASSDPKMWTEISQLNGQFIVEAMDNLQSGLNQIRDQLKNEDWKALFAMLENAKELRDEWYQSYGKGRGY